MTRRERLYIRDPFERVWRGIDRSGQCWEWTRSTRGTGYGGVVLDGRQKRAHRVVYEWAFGPIPEGMWVLHSCDNRLCCRLAHLRLGTAQENAADRDTRGRANRPPLRTHCRQGHEFTPENSYCLPSAPRTRLCRACRAIIDRARRERRRL